MTIGGDISLNGNLIQADVSLSGVDAIESTSACAGKIVNLVGTKGVVDLRGENDFTITGVERPVDLTGGLGTSSEDFEVAAAVGVGEVNSGAGAGLSRAGMALAARELGLALTGSLIAGLAERLARGGAAEGIESHKGTDEEVGVGAVTFGVEDGEAVSLTRDEIERVERCAGLLSQSALIVIRVT